MESARGCVIESTTKAATITVRLCPEKRITYLYISLQANRMQYRIIFSILLIDLLHAASAFYQAPHDITIVISTRNAHGTFAASRTSCSVLEGVRKGKYKVN